MPHAEVAAHQRSDEPRASARSRRRVIAVGIVVVLALAVVVVVLNWLGSHDAFTTLDGSSGDWAYVATFLFVFADAICALFPSETVLNAGATLAANGALDLGPLIVAGAAGAVAGDSALYWIARIARPRVQPKLDQAMRHPRVAEAMDFLGTRAPVLLVVGRYVPGLRFVVNATLGLAAYPYRRFLPWSALGGALWSLYTCTLAYLVGTSLAGFPLASIVVSATITTVALGVLFVIVRRRRAGAREAGAQPASSVS